MLALDTEGWGHFGAGRLDQAADAWVKAFELDPTAGNNLAPMLTRVAIATNDPDTAEHWAQVHWESVAHGGASEADHIALLAAIRGLRGDRNAATRDFRDAVRRYRDLRLDIDEAIMAIDMVYALGPTDSLTADTVARARTTVAANHARAYLDQLDAALAHGAHAVAGAGTPATARAERGASVPAS
jgi:tetratricopeptide (TPR) repeat protein